MRKRCPVCQCRWGDTDCIHFSGNGTARRPFKPSLNKDPDENNLVTCGRAGLGLFLPNKLVNPPAVNIYCTFDQPMQSNTVQGIIYNEVRYDTDSMSVISDFDLGNKITFNTPGVYFITLNVSWTKNPTGDRAIFIKRNGADYMTFDSVHAGDADLYVGQSIGIEDYFEAGEFVESLAKQDSGEILYIESWRSSPNFAAVLVA